MCGFWIRFLQQDAAATTSCVGSGYVFLERAVILKNPRKYTSIWGVNLNGLGEHQISACYIQLQQICNKLTFFVEPANCSFDTSVRMRGAKKRVSRRGANLILLYANKLFLHAFLAMCTRPTPVTRTSLSDWVAPRVAGGIMRG